MNHHTAASPQNPAVGTAASRTEWQSGREEASGLDYLYWTPTGRPARGLLVSVHGVTRQFTQQFQETRQIAAALDLQLLVPHFTTAAFPDYQRLGRTHRGRRADLALLNLLDALGHQPPRLPLILHGFSGGAQFAHRFALAHPDRTDGLVLMAPGWYTMPDPAVRYPYGLRTGDALTGVRLDLAAFLGVPLLTIVGGEDVQQDDSVRSGRQLDQRQGATRLARARTWHDDLRYCATRLAIDHPNQLCIVPGVSHDFGRLLAASLDTTITFVERCLAPAANPEIR